MTAPSATCCGDPSWNSCPSTPNAPWSCASTSRSAGAPWTIPGCGPSRSPCTTKCAPTWPRRSRPPGRAARSAETPTRRRRRPRSGPSSTGWPCIPTPGPRAFRQTPPSPHSTGIWGGFPGLISGTAGCVEAESVLDAPGTAPRPWGRRRRGTGPLPAPGARGRVRGCSPGGGHGPAGRRLQARSGICRVEQWIPPPPSPRVSTDTWTTLRSGYRSRTMERAPASAFRSPKRGMTTPPLIT